MKGTGVAAVANKNGFHGKPLADPEAAHRRARRHARHPRRGAEAREREAGASVPGGGELSCPRYELGTKEATRKAFGDALVALGGVRGDVVALDGEVGNSTYSEEFAAAHADRFIQSYIAEQQMVATAVGLQVRGWRPFAATFAAFLSRAYDFVRMAAVSRANLVIAGSHAGVSIGEDGPSQMALEDLASCAPSTARPCCTRATRTRPPRSCRRWRSATGSSTCAPRARRRRSSTRPTRHSTSAGRTVRQTDADAVTIVAAGITLHEAVKAADALAGEGIAARVVDLYTVKPIDAETLRVAAEETGRIVTVEDHWPEGGLGDAVLAALAEARATARVEKLAVRLMPGSGTPAELLAAAGSTRTTSRPRRGRSSGSRPPAVAGRSRRAASGMRRAA